ncbi:MAG TPA: alpha/beta hydrolase [Burkholderiaceae bacterium]|nr:alpha/beta hydrolase [Burkholderiaceae bacterium]HSB99252.1 alpha/beta hydrolase [Burkholderiaceae bacterium]
MSRSANQVSHLRIGSGQLRAELVVPAHAKSLVVLSRHRGKADARGSQRFVLAVLRRHGLATLRVDLPAAGGERAHPADSAWSEGVVEALAWLQRHGLWERVGLMACGSEAAAVLQAAAKRPASVSAIVVSAGEMDIADPRPLRVRAPTLLIVGGRDDELLQRNRELLRQLQCEKRLEVVPGGSRHFEEPGALDTMAQMAAHWFADHTDAVAAA